MDDEYENNSNLTTIIIIVGVVVVLGVIGYVMYTQKKNKIYELSGCQDDFTYGVEIKCDNGTTISDLNVKYGRWNNSICLDDSVNSNTRPMFKNYNLSVVARNKDTFDLASELKKVDPYQSINKHFTATWKCV